MADLLLTIAGEQFKSMKLMLLCSKFKNKGKMIRANLKEKK